MSATSLHDPRRYFEAVGRGTVAGGRSAAGLPLSGGHQPLQPAVRNLSAHVRGTGTAGRYELGAVHPHRRSGAEYRPRRAAWRRRADAGEGTAAHDPLPEGSRHLCAVQHQRHVAAAEDNFRNWSTPGWTSCACRWMRPTARATAAIRGKDFFNRIVRDVGKFTAFQQQIGAAEPARVAVADRPEGDRGPVARHSCVWPRRWA